MEGSIDTAPVTPPQGDSNTRAGENQGKAAPCCESDSSFGEGEYAALMASHPHRYEIEQLKLLMSLKDKVQCRIVASLEASRKRCKQIETEKRKLQSRVMSAEQRFEVCRDEVLILREENSKLTTRNLNLQELLDKRVKSLEELNRKLVEELKSKDEEAKSNNGRLSAQKEQFEKQISQMRLDYQQKIYILQNELNQKKLD
eukprot:Nk52_evm13s2449 gene=Nk52_evmTU13s2449